MLHEAFGRVKGLVRPAPILIKGKTMHVKNAVPMKAGVLASGVLLALFALAPCAQATPVHFSFGTSGVIGGSGSLTVQSVKQNGGSLSGTTQDQAMSANGTFSDATANLSDVKITGVLATTGTGSRSVVPASESNISADTSAGIASYDNLVFPAGLLQADCLPDPGASGPNAAGYPFTGGQLDPFGLMFTLDNGDVLNLWGLGNFNTATKQSQPLLYGYNLLAAPATDGSPYQVLDGGVIPGNGVTLAVSVPAPPFLWAFGAGLLGLFAWRRAAEKKRVLSDGRVDA